MDSLNKSAASAPTTTVEERPSKLEHLQQKTPDVQKFDKAEEEAVDSEFYEGLVDRLFDGLDDERQCCDTFQETKVDGVVKKMENDNENFNQTCTISHDSANKIHLKFVAEREAAEANDILVPQLEEPRVNFIPSLQAVPELPNFDLESSLLPEPRDQQLTKLMSSNFSQNEPFLSENEKEIADIVNMNPLHPYNVARHDENRNRPVENAWGGNFAFSQNEYPFKRWSLAGSLGSGTELATLRAKLEAVQTELLDLRRQHERTLNECQALLGQLEMNRESKSALEVDLQSAFAEMTHLRFENERFAQQKCGSDRQMLEMQAQLQRSQLERDEVVAGRSDADDLAHKLLDECDAARLECDSFRRRCGELQSESGELRQALAASRQLNEQMRAKIDALELRHSAHWHQMARDRDALRSNLDALHQEFEDTMAGNARLQHALQQRDDELVSLKQKHKALSSEYDRVMEERNKVLEENERLSDESGRQALIEQIRKFEIQVKFLQERDAFYRMSGGAETSSIGPKLEEMNTSRQNDIRLDEMRRQIESLKEQYESSRQELESAKQMREWALVERQRIVAERDSIRTMCDELRRDRDNAVTKLADAFRHTEELQRYKEQTDRELKRLKDRLDLDLKSTIDDSPCSPSNSRDSAIDNDMAEWEIDTLTINIVGSHRSSDIGLELRGGRDDPVFGTVVPVYVKAIEKNSKFDGILRIYDCLMQVNNIDVANMERRSVFDILKNSNSGVIVIKRRRLVGMKLISVVLEPNQQQEDFGVCFEDGVYVTRIKTSSLAAKSGTLAVGDRLIYVNGVPVQGKNAHEIDQIVRDFRGSTIELAVVKSPPVLSPMTPSASWQSANSYNNARHPTQNNFYPFYNNAGSNSTCKDQAVQACLSESTPETSPPAKKESLLDKVHDKLFGKHERKSTVRASASIPGDAEMNNVLPARWRAHPHAGGSERLTPMRHRPSPLGTGAFQPPNQANMAPGSPEQVLKQLDSILEASEKVYPNRPLANLADFDSKSTHSGGTWPKLKPNTLLARAVPPTCHEPCSSAGGFLDEATPLPIIQPVKRVKERKHLLPFFFSNGSPTLRNKAAASSGERDAFRKSVTSSVHPTDPHSDARQMARQRSAGLDRPMSYHPAMSNSAATKSRYSASPELSPAVYAKNFRTNERQAATLGRHSHRPQILETIGDDLMPYAPGGSGSSSATGSATTSRRIRTASQYDPPVYANLTTDFAFRRQHPSIFTKNTQHFNAPPRYKPPHPNNSSFSPSMIGHGHHHQQHETRTTNSSLEQDIDAQSITSQSSGFSRCGGGFNNKLNNPSFYNSQGSKSANKYDPTSPFRSYAQHDEYSSSSHSKLSQGDVRTIFLEKRSSHEALGISVVSFGNGVFVSSVSENSLAAKHGMQVGDQLLEVCGINMRSADTYYATNVLRQIPEQDINLVVQYNPERFFNTNGGASQQPTPRSTPVGSLGKRDVIANMMSRATATRRHSRESGTGGGSINNNSDSMNSLAATTANQPRIVYVKKDTSDWGFCLVGGNTIGVFIDRLGVDSPAYGPDGLRNGDQILEFDDMNFRKLTLEQALFELNQRPCDSEVSIKVHYNESKYQRCKTGAGDSFYVRANIERKAENIDELSYKTGDVLRVDNTVFNGVPGLWRAWLVDQEGRERSCGIIPSKSKLEEEASIKMSASEISAGGDGNSEGGGSRRGTIRRSWKFIRRSSRTSGATAPVVTSSTINHQRTSSKESRGEDGPGGVVTLAGAALLSHFLHDEPYQRVERIDYNRKRPLLIMGALTELFVAKLLEEHPHLFAQCVPECVQSDMIRKLEQGLEYNVYVDYRKRDKLFEVTSFAAVNEIIDKGVHCILNVGVAAIERLKRAQMFPVVVFIKFKNAKQIKEIGDVSSKQAKEIYEQASRTEIECYNSFSTVIQIAHNNMKYICQQIVSAVEHEQKKTLWVASNEPL